MGRRQNSSNSSISSEESDQSSDKPEQKSTLKRKCSQRNEFDSDSSDTSTCSVIKKVASTDLEPVVLKSTNEKPFRFYDPIATGRCLYKAIGQYESCKSLQNGNLVNVNCMGITKYKYFSANEESERFTRYYHTRVDLISSTY